MVKIADTSSLPPLDGPVLNPEPSRRTEGADRLGAELLDAARDLPSSAERLAKLAGGLHSLDPASLAGDDTRLAFWLNVYNALLRQALFRTNARGSVRLKFGLFSRSAWCIGGRRFSLDLIEHGLLRGNARIPLSWRRAAREGDPRLDAAPRVRDPRVHFALNCGARSGPPVRTYLSGAVSKQLDLATAAYFATEARLDRERGVVTLPRLMKYFRADFGTREDALRFAASHFDAADGEWLRVHLGDVRVRHSPYDWTISRDSTGKNAPDARFRG